MGVFIETLLAFAIIFGILVFVHEFGHFFVAKLVKIRVEVFSWGYGKRLFGVKKGETDYRVSIFPMGGYVKFSGEEAASQNKTPDAHDFVAKKRWERFLVLVMGSLMNIVLAVVLVAFINMVGVSSPDYLEKPPVIGWIEPGSPASLANLQVDDQILSIDKKITKTWSDVELAVGSKPAKVIVMEIRRGDNLLSVKLTTESKTRYALGYAGFFGKIMTEIRMIQPQSPAEKAGLKPGDVILAINSEPVYFYKFIEIIEKNPEKPLDFLIQRGEQSLTLEVTPRREGEIGKVGIMQGPKSVVKKYGFFAAFVESINANAKLTFMVIGFIKDLVTGEASARQLGGPIDIASFSYAAFRMGFMAMVAWLAFISLQLGIINLFPIPVLDGGQLLVLALEGLFRRDFSAKVKQIVMQVGFAIFVVLIAFVILNDIVKRLPNGWASLIPF